jgi:uncharacterized protein YegP (UPF0339 family)
MDPTTQPKVTAPTTTTRKNEPWIEVARDDEGWHWQLWSGNGRAIARNAVAYDTKKHCLQAIATLPGIWPTVNVVAMVSEAE